jgi:hypothetical protein
MEGSEPAAYNPMESFIFLVELFKECIIETLKEHKPSTDPLILRSYLPICGSREDMNKAIKQVFADMPGHGSIEVFEDVLEGMYTLKYEGLFVNPKL